MADVFQPKFVDLVRNLTTTTGTSDFVLGPPVNGFTSFLATCQVGDSFYYSAIGIDRPGEREVGRGTLLAGGVVSRAPTEGSKTNFSAGTKVISLIAAAEWFARVEAGPSAGSRAELAATSAGQRALLLCEAGREGQFVWDGSNLSALVAADLAQGLTVAPASDPSGASGAWIRKFSGSVNARWFGLQPGSGNGSANDAAMANLFSTLRALGENDTFYYRGCAAVLIPAGHYEFNSTIELTDGTFILEGAGGVGHGVAGGSATLLKFPAGVTGIRVQSVNTSGASSTRAVAKGANGSIIRHLALQGAYAGAEAEAHGVHLRAQAMLEDVYVYGFEGDGIYANDTGGSGGATEGNANSTHLHWCHVEGNRRGVFMDGGDVNIWTVIGCYANTNRQAGFWDSSFLGNSYFGCQADNNGMVQGSTPTAVSYSGKWYAVKFGQEAGASTNAPSGTTDDNQWWYYIDAGAPNPAININAWTAGTTYRAGGSFMAEGGGGGNNLYAGCYIEGRQTAQLYPPAMVVGGSGFAANVRGVAASFANPAGNWQLTKGLNLGGSLTAEGDSHSIGPTSGPVGNAMTKYNYVGSSHKLSFGKYDSAGGFQEETGYIWAVTGGSLYINGFVEIPLRIAGTTVATVDPSGINLASGCSLKVAGTQVVGGRGASLPADATDLASAIALTNAIKARLKVTGGHGLVAD